MSRLVRRLVTTVGSEATEKPWYYPRRFSVQWFRHQHPLEKTMSFSVDGISVGFHLNVTKRICHYGNSLGESRVDSLPRTLEADST